MARINLTPRQYIQSLIIKHNLKSKLELRELVLIELKETDFSDNYYWKLLANIETTYFENETI